MCRLIAKRSLDLLESFFPLEAVVYMFMVTFVASESEFDSFLGFPLVATQLALSTIFPICLLFCKTDFTSIEVNNFPDRSQSNVEIEVDEE